MKVIFLTGRLQNYRIPIFERICELSDISLTVAHSSKPILKGHSKIKEIIIEENNFWKFTTHDESLVGLCSQYDVVICMLYLQKLSFMRLLTIRKRKFKLIFWGIGLKASLSSKFDTPTVLNRVRYIIAKKADAMIFYSDYARNKYISKGIDPKKLFVMQNTVAVSNFIESSESRDRLLFVGTLYRAKKIFELLESYYKVYIKEPDIPHLDIIGNGEEYENIEKWIEHRGLKSNISLHGAIYDESILEKYFKQSIATISPGQAGLSVLKSMGYGVPFITMRDAITGGERLNIEDGYNGVLYQEDEDLEGIILDIINNKKFYLKLGENAKEYYDNKRSPDIMANGFINAAQYVQSVINN